MTFICPLLVQVAAGSVSDVNFGSAAGLPFGIILSHRAGDIFVWRPDGWPAIDFAALAGISRDHAGSGTDYVSAMRHGELL